MEKVNRTGLTLLIVGAGFTVLIIVTLLISQSKRKKKIKECEDSNGNWDKKKKVCIPAPLVENLPVNTSTNTGGGSSSSTISWKPNSLANEIATNMEGWNANTYPETADKILALTDPKIKSLYTFYNKYKAKDYPTLTKLYQNEWSDWAGKYNLVVKRLKGLGLY